MGTKEMTIKLMLDSESKRLIFAEASKDFIDFLIFILSVPVGTVTRLLTSESMVGSIGNIYKSVANFKVSYMRQNVNKDNILYPMLFSSPTNIPLQTRAGSSINISPELYACWNPVCKSGITNVAHGYVQGVQCPSCDKYMNKPIEFVNTDKEGYVKTMASYMVYDDLSITSLSTMDVVSMINKFNVTKFEERTVKIGNVEALELLKASFQSTTVLTDVFLKTKKRKRPGNDHGEMEIDIKTLSGKIITLEVDPSDTIYYVKTKFEYMQGVPPKQIRLLFAGKELADDRTLADCNIVNKSKIFFLLNLRGC